MRLIVDASGEKPIYQQIEEQIAAQILRGELASGTCLPPIRTVALEMRISVITVKKAWEELERRGLIATITGKGCFVRELPAGELDDKRAEAALERLRKDVEYCKSLGLSEAEIAEMVRRCFGDG